MFAALETIYYLYRYNIASPLGLISNSDASMERSRQSTGLSRVTVLVCVPLSFSGEKNRLRNPFRGVR